MILYHQKRSQGSIRLVANHDVSCSVGSLGCAICLGFHRGHTSVWKKSFRLSGEIRNRQIRIIAQLIDLIVAKKRYGQKAIHRCGPKLDLLFALFPCCTATQPSTCWVQQTARLPITYLRFRIQIMLAINLQAPSGRSVELCEFWFSFWL